MKLLTDVPKEMRAICKNSGARIISIIQKLNAFVRWNLVIEHFIFVDRISRYKSMFEL